MSSLRDDPLLADVPLLHGYRTLALVVLYSEIGRGGMGAVYRGRHLNLDVDVAVKCLLDRSGEQDMIGRFRKEAMLVARIRSPHLVQVMDVRNEYGLHYIVMEFVAGETAERRAQRRGPLPPREAVAIALHATKGLAAAHNKGVIHRDVKPGNVLLSTEGEVKLTDLGIAKAETSDSLMTMTTAVMGTPLYMPPEQFEGAAKVTPASDVYSMGATLAYMLLGQHAIRGRTLPEIARQVTVQGFPDLGTLREGLPASLVELVRRATDMDPTRRFADAPALAVELQRVLDELGGVPDLADEEAGASRAKLAVAPSHAVMAEIRRAVTTRSQSEFEPEAATLATMAGRSRVRDRGAADGGGDAGDIPVTLAGRRPGRLVAMVVGLLVIAAGAAGLWAWGGGGGSPDGRRTDEQASTKPGEGDPQGSSSLGAEDGTQTGTQPGPGAGTEPADSGRDPGREGGGTDNGGKPDDGPANAGDGAGTDKPVGNGTVEQAGDQNNVSTEGGGEQPVEGGGDVTPGPERGGDEPIEKHTDEKHTDGKNDGSGDEVTPPASTFATAVTAAREQAGRSAFGAAVAELDHALAAAGDDAERAKARQVADEVLRQLYDAVPEDLSTAVSERAGRIEGWPLRMSALASAGCPRAALLLVESKIAYDDGDQLQCDDVPGTLLLARQAADADLPRGCFFAGELLRHAGAPPLVTDGVDRWQLVHEYFQKGVELGEPDCASRMAGIQFSMALRRQPAVWQPPGEDNLDAWAAGLARRSAKAGSARGHFIFAQFLLRAATDKEYAKRSGVSEQAEQTTYPRELEQAARQGYMPAVTELRQKEHLSWAAEALERLRQEGVLRPR